MKRAEQFLGVSLLEKEVIHCKKIRAEKCHYECYHEKKPVSPPKQELSYFLVTSTAGLRILEDEEKNLRKLHFFTWRSHGNICRLVMLFCILRLSSNKIMVTAFTIEPKFFEETSHA